MIYHYPTIDGKVVEMDEKQWRAYKGKKSRNACCGDILSESAGLPPRQVEAGNKMMAANGCSARFLTDGKMVSTGRREYLKALRIRGLHNNEEISGGNSEQDARPGDPREKFYKPHRVPRERLLRNMQARRR